MTKLELINDVRFRFPLPRREDQGEGKVCVQQARRLRRKLTDAERKLWSRLRNCQVADLKFRRQHPLGDRIVDFFCSEAKLAIELDGSGHASYRGQTSDLDREIEFYE